MNFVIPTGVRQIVGVDLVAGLLEFFQSIRAQSGFPKGSRALISTAFVFEYILKKKEQSQNLWTFSNLINSAG